MGIKKIHTIATCAIKLCQWLTYLCVIFRSTILPFQYIAITIITITTITIHIKDIPVLLKLMKDIIYYYLLIRYYVIWTLLFVVLKFLIMILWFVTCVITFAPFCICKDTKYNQKYKILNTWKNVIHILTRCTYGDYK